MPIKVDNKIMNASMAPLGTGTEHGLRGTGALLKRIVGNLMNCRVELAHLSPPWVSRIPAGWFYVYCIRSGTCELIPASLKAPLETRSGNIVILPQCREHRLRDSHETNWSIANQISWFDTTPLKSSARDNEIGSPDATNILVCRFPKPNMDSTLLLHELPDSLLFRSNDAECAGNPEPIIAIIENEIAQPHTTQRIVEHLFKALLLQIVRTLDHRLFARSNLAELTLADPVIDRALGLMQSRPAENWTVATLATTVGVSRSTFAVRFVDQVGMTPMCFLRRERMRQAAELLCVETLGIKEISILVGYRSESAFSGTFKLWSGITPAAFRRERQQ